jgi:serine/threonine protein kinase/Tol biopolymer transport system component
VPLVALGITGYNSPQLMPIRIGTRLGCHEITGLLGKGGMGEVYRARDTKLKRDVAIKILPDEFSQDPSRVVRFQREAELLASLNHPNIAAIYDLQEADESRFLVLELVEGETLAERIERGRIPVEEALRIALQIAQAFEAAHEKGVVHRDLKPANVKITPDGKVKVLDFGLAKALETSPQQAASNSPTILTAATNGAVILGTAGYMSPEQARGHAADERSDIFSFGCVLYETLTGRQAFQGETVTDLIASVVAREPDFAALPVDLNPKTEEVIRRCLAKNRKDRWHAIADVRVEIESIIADPHGLKVRATRVERRPLWRRALPIAVAAILAALVGAAAVWNWRSSQSGRPARFSIVLPESQRFTTRGLQIVAISPDGANIVYVANEQLYLRSIGDLEAKPIQGTKKSAVAPFFSPDGNWIGFYARTDHKFEKVSVTGGAAVAICDADNFPWSASWEANDQIFIAHPTGDIQRVSAAGGEPKSVVTAKPAELLHGPQLLPDDDSLLFTVASTTIRFDRWDKAQIVVQSLKTGERKVLIEGGSDARYLPTGHIVYALGATLFAIRFDVKHLHIVGNPIPIVEGVMRSYDGASGAADFGVSNGGSLVYAPGELAPGRGREARTLALVDRAGIRKLLGLPVGNYNQPRISSDGKQLALDMDDGKDRFVAIYDLTGSSPLRRLTFGGHNERPIWTRDGKRVVFASDRDGDPALFWQPADNSGPAELLTKVEPVTVPQAEAWTPDSKVLLFSNRIGGRSGGIATFSLGDPMPKVLAKEPWGNPGLSPDGRWLAYSSNESGGISNIYVEPYPRTKARHQISTNGGISPLWSPDGKQLYYVEPFRGQLMSVDIQASQPNLVPGKTTPLPIEGIVTGGPRGYDITPDGKSFVVLQLQSQAESTKAPPDQINVTLNWFEELKQRLPVN